MAEGELASPDAQLDFDDDTLKVIATVYLEEGNKEYRRKEASNALSFYTQGLQVNCKDDVLNAKLYSNRATAYFSLGNYQETLNNVEAAVTLQPTFIKAIERGASACVKLKRYEEAASWCDKGLAIDKNNKTLVDLRTKCPSQPDTSQETKPQNMKGTSVTHIATSQKGADPIPKSAKDEVEDKSDEGYANHGQNDFEKAIIEGELFLNVAKEVGDKHIEEVAYNKLGSAYQRLGQFKTAIDYHQRQLNISKEVGNKAGEAAAYGNLGCVYQSLGDFKTAIVYHERELKIAKELGDKAGESAAYGHLGCVYRNLGDYKTAIVYHERHLKIAKELGDKAQEGKASCNLGCAYQGLGDFKTATDCYERQLNISKEVGDKAGEAAAYGNLGCVYQSLGYFKEAIDYHERDLKIAKELGDKAGEGSAYCNLGNAYRRLGHIKTAIDYYERDLKIAKEVGDKVGEGNAYCNLGNTYQCLCDVKTAIDYQERHLKIAKEVGNKAGEGLAHGNLGNAYKKLGDIKIAIEHYERRLKIAKEVGDKEGMAISFYNLGKSFELQQSLPKAIYCFHSSVKALNIIRHDLKGKDEWKISYRNMNEESYRSLWRLLLRQGEVEKALFAAEEGRAQALNDLMELSYGLETTYCQSPHLEESTQNLLSFPRSVTVFIAINEQDIVFWVVQDRKDVQLRKKKLGDNISLNLNDFLRYLIMAASRELNVRALVKCEDRSLDKLDDENVPNDLSPQTPATPVPLQMSVLRTLYDLIIDPIADLIHGDELILVPEGPLCLVSYAALLDSNSRCFCDVCRIRVIPSLTTLKLITDSPNDYHSKTGVLLVGDPWVEEVVISDEKKLEQLPFARKEVEVIGRILNTTPLIGRVATKDEVLRRLFSVALIHIAAHGRMETGEIALAPNTTRASQVPAKEDFLLTMKDVTSSRIHARLVVLSCCHSGRGEIKAEGVVGIARAFLGAGARAVLVSLWAIDDAATLEFMKSFYTHLVNGISASESLNRAMKYLRESEEFNEVKFWAPFLLIGDDVTMELGGTELGNCT